MTLRDDDIHADLAHRDFTINAMAEPLAGGELLDPHGGRADLERRLVRMVSAAGAARRTRCAACARSGSRSSSTCEIDPATGAAAAPATRAGIERVAAERVFGELKRVISADAVRRGLALMDEHGLTDVVLPELLALRGIEQSHFHHADVHDHTLEVLDQVAILQRDCALLAEPLSDELTRGQAMRWAALLHDAAKPQTRDFLPDGRVTFIGHDVEGAKLARDVLGRLRSSQRLRDYVAALDRAPPRCRLPRPPAPARPPHDLALPARDAALQRGHHALHRRRPPAPPAGATPSRRSRRTSRSRDELIAAAREPVGEAARPRRRARATSPPGPRLGEILAQLEEDRFAGVISTREEALARARELA